MEITPQKPIILNYKCPSCGVKISTTDYFVTRPRGWFTSGQQVFSCSSCGIKLTPSPKLSFYINIFAVYFCFVFLAGVITTFFVDEPMHVTFFMLGASTFFIPLLILAVINNKTVLYKPDEQDV